MNDAILLTADDGGKLEQMLFANSLGSCPGPGYRLCRRNAFSYACAAQRNAHPTDRYISAANGNIVSNRYAYTTHGDAGTCAGRPRSEHYLHVQ